MFALTMIAALGPAVRAGRLSAIDAIAAGRAPRSGRGHTAHRLAARLRLPRPVGLGVAAPFARPARTLVTLAAVAFGATAVIFAVGLHSSLARAAAAQSQSATVPVQIQQSGYGAGPNQMPTAAQLAQAIAVVRAQPGTAREVALYGNRVTVPGISQQVQSLAFDGPSAWTGYALIAGHWYDAPRRGRREHLVPRRERPRHRRQRHRGHRNRRGHRPHRRRGVRPLTPAAPVWRQPDPARHRHYCELLAG